MGMTPHEPSAEGPSEVPPEWRPQLPQPGSRPAPREDVPQNWRGPGMPSVPATGPSPVRAPTQSVVAFFGDVVRTGPWTAAVETSTMQLFGDVKLDLRQVLQPGETLQVTAYSMFGDIRIAVPPGTRVDIEGLNMLGDTQHDIAPEAQQPGENGARVVLRAYSVFGDVRIRTMPQVLHGKQPRGWRWLGGG